MAAILVARGTQGIYFSNSIFWLHKVTQNIIINKDIQNVWHMVYLGCFPFNFREYLGFYCWEQVGFTTFYAGKRTRRRTRTRARTHAHAHSRNAHAHAHAHMHMCAHAHAHLRNAHSRNAQAHKCTCVRARAHACELLCFSHTKLMTPCLFGTLC